MWAIQLILCFVREPTEQQKTYEPRWSMTTIKVLSEIKSRRTVESHFLASITGYKMGTINAQASILRRMGLITTTLKEKVGTPSCPSHSWIEEIVTRSYGDSVVVRKCENCGERSWR
jgi:hypothetical protein